MSWVRFELVPASGSPENPSKADELSHLVCARAKDSFAGEQDILLEAGTGLLEVGLPACEQEIIAMDETPQVAARVEEADRTGLAAAKAQLGQSCCGVLLPQPGRVSCAVETATEEAAEPLTRALGGRST